MKVCYEHVCMYVFRFFSYFFFGNRNHICQKANFLHLTAHVAGACGSHVSEVGSWLGILFVRPSDNPPARLPLEYTHSIGPD